MRILLDHSTPAPLRYWLLGHNVETAYERGWAELTNGELLRAAEDDGFDAMITADKRIRYQQNLAGRRLALVVLETKRLDSNSELEAGCDARDIGYVPWSVHRSRNPAWLTRQPHRTRERLSAEKGYAAPVG
ncbi:MAG TPA: hypothetical protein VH639_26815 [Bryobacteraceae bacterium]